MILLELTGATLNIKAYIAGINWTAVLEKIEKIICGVLMLRLCTLGLQ